MPSSRVISLRIAQLLLRSIGACALLSACSQQASPILESLRTIGALLSSSAPANDTQLNPEYEHLRVTLDGRSAFVTLGDIDKRPDGNINVYYGGGGLVIRVQNGRLAGVNGLTTEWRNVVMHNAPAWAAAARAKHLEWRRARDFMPGYQYGIEEQIILTPIAPPLKNPLLETSGEGLYWFEEHIAASNATRDSMKLPPARYAVSLANNQETVVYGEQCLAVNTCLTWQRWTPRKK